MPHYITGANDGRWVTACGITLGRLTGPIRPDDEKCPDCVLVLDLIVELDAVVAGQA